MAQECTQRGFPTEEIELRTWQIKNETQPACFYESEDWAASDTEMTMSPRLGGIRVGEFRRIMAHRELLGYAKTIS